MNTELKINPKVLKWARQESGYSPSEIADKVRIDVTRYDELENTGTGITLGELISISKACKRQIAVFFLPYVPPETKKPKDFRKLGAAKSKLSEKTLLSIRRTERYQEFLLSQNGEKYYKEKYKWISQLSQIIGENNQNLETVATQLRELLQFKVIEQLSDELKVEDSYKKWRNSIETNLGINVFQFLMPQEETQGFSYSYSYPYCVVINNAYTSTSKTFTLFHEIFHIIKNQSGLCKPDDILFEINESEEFICNSFAGCLLIPSSEIINTKNKDKIYEYAQKFKVSSEVYLRRLFTLGIVNKNEFFELLIDIRNSVKIPEPHYSNDPIRKSMNSRGQNLFETTIDAMNKKNISYSTASDILGLKINHIYSI